MSKEEQKEFLTGIIKTVTDEMISKLDKIPENWEGGELRYWIRENFNSIVWSDRQDKRAANYRNYINDVITKGL